jgi:hypothetical protein
LRFNIHQRYFFGFWCFREPGELRTAKAKSPSSLQGTRALRQADVPGDQPGGIFRVPLLERYCVSLLAAADAVASPKRIDVFRVALSGLPAEAAGSGGGCIERFMTRQTVPWRYLQGIELLFQCSKRSSVPSVERNSGSET